MQYHVAYSGDSDWRFIPTCINREHGRYVRLIHGGFKMSFAVVQSSPELVELLDQVEQAVQARTGGRILDLQVRMEEGRIVVSGRTSTYYNKQLVTHAIRDAIDDLPVLNEVQVC